MITKYELRVNRISDEKKAVNYRYSHNRSKRCSRCQNVITIGEHSNRQYKCSILDEKVTICYMCDKFIEVEKAVRKAMKI